MAVFSCTTCGWMYEHLVAAPYARKLLRRMEACPKCDRTRTFRFVSHSGMVGNLPGRPAAANPPSNATLWWRKQRTGKTAQAPLDSVCGRHEW